MSKQYGLTFPKKNLAAPKAGNIFGNDDDSDEEKGTNLVKKALKAENEKNKVKKQIENAKKKAIEEDPTIFMYDEVYDEMEHAKKKEKEAIKKIERKPKYIHDLLSAAEQRKKEQELRKDRIIQKEIEEEESQFPDKERFVTSGYKKKLEEQKKFEEEQKRKDSLTVGVTEQKDMSGFYRHLYRQTVEKNAADVDVMKTEKLVNKNNVEIDTNIDKDDTIPSDSTSESDNENAEKTKMEEFKKSKKERHYRKRVHENSDSENEKDEIPVQEEKKEEGKSVEKDDSAESVCTDVEKLPKKPKISENKENNPESNTQHHENENTVKKTPNSTTTDKPEKVTKDKIEPEEEKKKINIWEKRTVGPVFEAALQRYLIRKQERLTSL